MKSENPDSQTGSRLLAKKEELFTRWEKRVRDEPPAASEQPRLALINSLPKLIDEIIQTLTYPEPREKLKAVEKHLAIEHGRERSVVSAYSLDQVIDEYHVLREVIFEVLEEENQLSVTDRNIILDALQIAIRNAAAEFVRDRQRENKDAQIQREDFQKLLNKTENSISPRDLENVFNSLPGLFLVLRPNLKVVAASEEWLKAANYKRSELLGNYLFDVVTDNPDDDQSGKKNLKSSLERVAKNKVADSLPVQKYSVPDGNGGFKEKYWSPINSPVLDDHGNLIYLVHRVEDVTALVKDSSEKIENKNNMAAVDVLQRNKELHSTSEKHRTDSERNKEILRASVEAIEDYGMIILDKDGNISSWNTGAAKITGLHKNDAIGKHFSMLYPEDSVNRGDPDRHLRIATNLTRYRGEGFRLRNDRSLYLADVLITGLFREDGELFGFSKIFTDLTKRDQDLQEKEQSRIDIASLTSEKELRDKFVNTLSHDLRNPLAAAKVSAQMIRRQNCDNERHEELSNRIVNAVNRADSMLNDLLDVSRIRSGQFLSLDIQELNLNSLLEEIRDEFITIHGQRLNLEMDKDVKGCWDSQKIRRAIENLLNNALKYGSRVEPITLGLTHSENRVHISVTNMGPPIDSSELQTLFDPFHRTRTSKGKEGWGLGLTLVRGVAEAHGGFVQVQSEEKSGTVFTIDIPKKH